MVRPKGKSKRGTSGPDGQPTPQDSTRQDYINKFKGYRTKMAVLNQLEKNTVFPGTGVSIPKANEKNFSAKAKAYSKLKKEYPTVPVWEDRNIANIGSKLGL